MKRKKRVTALLMLCILLLAIVKPVYAENEPTLYATYAAVTDAETGRVLFAKRGFEQVPMASTTKILTCIIALEQAELSDTVSVSSYAAQMPQVRMGMREGEQYILGDLLYALMLESYNDVAVAIAEHIGGTVEGFARLMNEKAATICDKQFYFITPNGLDATATVNGKTKEHSISASNLSRIMSYCCFLSPQKDEFLKITRTTGKQITSQETQGHPVRVFSLNNHNRMLSDERVVSGKTGFTAKAGYCYVSGVTIKDHNLGISLLACGWPNNKTYKWRDMQALLGFFSENLTDYTVSAKQTMLPQVTADNLCHHIGSSSDRKNSELKIVFRNPEWKRTYTGLLGESCISCINIQKNLSAPLKKGTVVGTADWYIGESKVASMPILIADDYESNTYKNCLIHTFNIFLTICINSHAKLLK